jgi:sugar lactone lactonase YvrE
LSRNKTKEKEAVKQQERKRQYGSWTSTSNELLLKIDSNDSKIDDDDDVYVTSNG